MSSLTFLLAGQDITSAVDEFTVDIESNLGQGAGVPTGQSGRATTAKFDTSLGPVATALGAGQALPHGPLINRYSPDVSKAVASTLSPINSPVSVTQDVSVPWNGFASTKVVCDALHSGEGVCAFLPVAAYSPGETVTFSVYLWGSARVYTFCYSDVTGQIGPSPSPTLTGAWTRYSVTCTLPNPLPAGNIGLRIYSYLQAAQTFWVGGIQVESGSTATPWVVGGTYVPGPLQLVRQGELIVKDTASGTNIFGGYVTKLTDLTDKVQNYSTVECVDYWNDLDRIIVNEVYTSATDTFIISDLLSTYAPSIDTSLLVMGQNFFFNKKIFRSKTLMKALQEITDTTGFAIWIDPYKRLHYLSLSSAQTAPFSLSDVPNGSTSFGHLVINRVVFTGGKKPTPDFTQDISPQANGNNTTFVLAYNPHDTSDGKIHVLVNGGEKVVGHANGSSAANTLKSQGGLADVLVNVDTGTLQFDVAPAAGAAVLAKYRYNAPLVMQLTDMTSFAFFGRYFDGRIVDDTIFDQQTALQRCRILLSEQSYGLVSLTVQFRQPGLQAGMLLPVVNSKRGINATFVVQSVKTLPKGAGKIWYEADLGAWNWNLIDVLVASAHATTPTDLTQDESTSIIQVQQPGFNLQSAFAVTTSVRTSGQFYARSAPVGDGHDGYPGFMTITS
jgi:hypothetical protein